MSKNRNISRVDVGATHGYQVRMMRRRKSYAKFFADGKMGGRSKALAAARKYRDKLQKSLRTFSRREIARIKSERNTSGVVGIRYVNDVDRRGNWEYTYGYWVAQWSPSPGVRKSKRFSVTKYGHDAAYEMAVRARKNGVRKMDSAAPTR